MACAAAWHERDQPAEKKIGGGRGCWRRVEVAWDRRRPKTAAARQTGDRRRRPYFPAEKEEDDTVGGPGCKKEKD